MIIKKSKSTMSAWGFIMTVLGAAVGLGSIWGFPTQINKYGGTFWIPFIIALVVCALPILLIEINLGNKYRQNYVQVFEQLGQKPATFFGFLQTAVVWLMSVFYSVLVAWSLLALLMAFLPGLRVENFFLTKLIHQTNTNPQNFQQLGNISWEVLLSLIIVWIITAIILLGGVVKGIDKANKIFIPTLFIMILIVAIYTMTLPGALIGLQTMFAFNAQKLLAPSIWSDAFGQAFFMLSTCTGAIIIFSSHAPKNQDNSNKGFIIMFGTTIVALLTACTVFCATGAIAFKNLQSLDAVFSDGPTLIFQVFPKVFNIITQQTGLVIISHLLAIIFFLSVFFAGLSSLIAMIEAVINPLITQWKIKRYQALAFAIVGAFILGIIFTFNNGTALIAGLGTWVAGIWQMIIGIFELWSVIIFWKCYDSLMIFNNNNSWFKWGKIFKIWCLIFIPLVIFCNLILAFYHLITNIITNTFIYLTIGASMGLILILLLTIFFYYYQLVKLRNCLNCKI